MMRFGLTLIVIAISFLAAGLATELARGHVVVQASAPIIGCAIAVASCSMAVRRPESSLMGMALGGAVAGILSLVAFTYGTYIAYLSGWSSLDVSQFGSNDHRGQAWISIFIALWVLPVALVGSVVAALTWAFGHRVCSD